MIIPQYFKGDPKEIQMFSVMEPVFSGTNSALDAFYAGGYDSAPFLLAMYDIGAMPFSDRVRREVFVDFIRGALLLFPSTGVFESYIYVLRALFGSEVQILFTVPGPGQLNIDITSIDNILFDWTATVLEAGVYVDYQIVDDLGNFIQLASLPGINSENELALLFSELIPVGIYTEITLGFVVYSNWVDDLDSNIVDNLGNNIVFWEPGE